jgi:transcriptional antiterminator RfaH
MMGDKTPVSENPPEKKWYAVYTRPRAEKKVHDELTKKGVECYLPMQRTLKQWSDRKKMVEQPLFNSYLFVKILMGPAYYDILGVLGVVKFVHFGKKIATIRDSQIYDIKLLLEHITDIEVSSEPIEAEARVEIMAGPLKGIEGVVSHRKGSQYFAVRIEELGTNMFISIPASYLRVL